MAVSDMTDITLSADGTYGEVELDARLTQKGIDEGFDLTRKNLYVKVWNPDSKTGDEAERNKFWMAIEVTPIVCLPS